MASGNFTLYGANKDDIDINTLLAQTLKMALVTSAYSPNYTSGGHDDWADASAAEIAAGNGYTAGGVILTGLAKNAIANGWRFNTNNAAWVASGSGIPAWRYAIMYVSGSLWGLTNPLVGSFLGDISPADVTLTTSGQGLTLICPSAGWFDVP